VDGAADGGAETTSGLGAALTDLAGGDGPTPQAATIPATTRTKAPRRAFTVGFLALALPDDRMREQ
jgi:hypothetical protein